MKYQSQDTKRPTILKLHPSNTWVMFRMMTYTSINIQGVDIWRNTSNTNIEHTRGMLNTITQSIDNPEFGHYNFWVSSNSPRHYSRLLNLNRDDLRVLRRSLVYSHKLAILNERKNR